MGSWGRAESYRPMTYMYHTLFFLGRYHKSWSLVNVILPFTIALHFLWGMWVGENVLFLLLEVQPITRPTRCSLKDDPLVLAGDFNTKPEVRQWLRWLREVGSRERKSYGGKVRSNLSVSSRPTDVHLEKLCEEKSSFEQNLWMQLAPSWCRKEGSYQQLEKLPDGGPGPPVVSSQMLHSPKVTAFKFLKKVGLSAPISEISSEPTIDFQGFFS